MDRAVIYQFSATYRCQRDSLMASHQHLVPNLLCFDILVSFFWQPLQKNALYFTSSDPILTFFLALYLAYIYSAILSYILFGILFHILCDILFGILSHIWHSIWHSIWHIFWHTFWHSTWHIFWHSIWHLSGRWGKNTWLVKVFFWGDTIKLKQWILLQTSQVCVNRFSASATRQLSGGCRRDIEQRFQSCFLTLWTLWGLWTSAMFCWYHPTRSRTMTDVMSPDVMSLCRFVDDSNRRRSHPLSIFPMSGDILGDWHECTPMAWPSLEKWWFNGLCWRKPWWFAPPN